MKARPSGQPTALLTGAQASKLLDEVVYERVIAHVDLEGIHAFECELGQILGELGPFHDGSPGPLATAQAMIEAALARIPTDPRRALALDSFPADDCPLCAMQAVHADDSAPEPRHS